MPVVYTPSYFKGDSAPAPRQAPAPPPRPALATSAKPSSKQPNQTRLVPPTSSPAADRDQLDPSLQGLLDLTEGFSIADPFVEATKAQGVWGGTVLAKGKGREAASLPVGLADRWRNDILVDVPAPGEEDGSPTPGTSDLPSHPDRLCCAYAESCERELIPFLIPPYPAPPGALHFSDDAVQQTANVLFAAVSKQTLQSYGSAVKRYLKFCDEENIDPALRFPAQRATLVHFLASHGGRIQADSIAKYLYGLTFWHSVYFLELDLPSSVWRSIRKGLKAREPGGRDPRPPVTFRDLLALREYLDLDSPEGACIWAAATCAFFAMARPGEVTVRSVDEFDPDLHASGEAVRFVEETADFPAYASIQLPRDKVRGKKGDSLIITSQLADPRLDPIAALRRHLELNSPSSSDFLFSSIPRDRSRERNWPLTYSHFVGTVNKALRAAGREAVNGHSFRIGGATFFLLADVHPDYVRQAGHWRSDAFMSYWRRVKVIAARNLSDAQIVDADGSLPNTGDVD